MQQQKQRIPGNWTNDWCWPKKKIGVGCWNVCTMHKAGRVAQVVNEIQEKQNGHDQDKEARWTGSGMLKE